MRKGGGGWGWERLGKGHRRSKKVRKHKGDHEIGPPLKSLAMAKVTIGLAAEHILWLSQKEKLQRSDVQLSNRIVSQHHRDPLRAPRHRARSYREI